jgi:hypothetical protein
MKLYILIKILIKGSRNSKTIIYLLWVASYLFNVIFKMIHFDTLSSAISYFIIVKYISQTVFLLLLIIGYIIETIIHSFKFILVLKFLQYFNFISPILNNINGLLDF